MSMSDNWRLDVKFQGCSIDLVGRVPAEKRALLRDFPRRLAITTKAKLGAIPPKGFFCKFVAKNGHDMKAYMKKHACALCVQFVASTFTFTLYLLLPVVLKSLKCLHRLRKSGASADSIKSLCTDRDGVVIGFIVSEVNVEMEEKLQARIKVMEELESTAKAISNTFGDPMLEFDLLLDQLDTKPSAIQACSKFIVRHEHLHDAICPKLAQAMDAMQSSKARASIVYVVHDVVKAVRANYPQKDRNTKMRESALVLCLERILFRLAQKLDGDARQNPNLRAVFDFWTKWGLQYATPVETQADALKVDAMAKIDATFAILEREVSRLSDASSSPIKPSAPPEVVAFMRKHRIQPGPWEIYLERASRQEMEELDGALELNTKYLGLNQWDPSEKGGRRSGEMFLHHYTKCMMPWLLHASSSSHPSLDGGKKARAKDSLTLLRDAFLCTWELDSTAARAVSDIQYSLLDDMWKKMEFVKCQNPSAFVFGKVRRVKTIQFATSPATDAILKTVEDEAHVDASALVAELTRVFQLDTMAHEMIAKVKTTSDLCYIAKELCHRCRHHKVANPSVHMVKLCQKVLASTNPRKVYSSLMKSLMSRQMKLSAFDQEIKKKRKLDAASASSSPVPENDTTNALPFELSDAELAAVKRRIPKPPKLLFKKVDLKTITHTETNDNGTVGVAVSGIPNAGKGLFNLSSHAWPAFSVVCIFGVRRITKEMHHDGLNKVARCGELGETFVVVNGAVRDVDKFQTQYGHRLMPFDGLVDADGSVGGYPNDRVYEYPANVYWDASGFYNNCILVPGCVIENPRDTTSPIVLNQLYIVTWKEVAVREEFFLAYGTSYYEDDEKDTSTTSEGTPS
ncbi:hypothetical protein PsorP6_000579 [Peronosclerospora sorghi]|uniref:Uncharacterized protein n=1 Tax=Peronosclerospora sorghi TaxID=230839 RepID=A0ACC0WS95_9STRA|nr:hypothetical protein PsorP6_000579 [Peronosclerospora sorghi]